MGKEHQTKKIAGLHCDNNDCARRWTMFNVKKFLKHEHRTNDTLGAGLPYKFLLMHGLCTTGL